MNEEIELIIDEDHPIGDGQVLMNQSKILIAKEGLRAAYYHMLCVYRDTGSKLDEPIMIHYKNLIVKIDSEIKNIKKTMELL